MHTYTHKLPRRTAQQVPALRAGITTGFSTGKKLPHAALSGCNQPHQAYNPVGIHQMAPPEHASGKQAYYSFIDPEKMKGWNMQRKLAVGDGDFSRIWESNLTLLNFRRCSNYNTLQQNDPHNVIYYYYSNVLLQPSLRRWGGPKKLDFEVCDSCIW